MKLHCVILVLWQWLKVPNGPGYGRRHGSARSRGKFRGASIAAWFH
jgi:hypothetical protein